MSETRRIVAVRDLKERLGWPWSYEQTWRMVKKGKLPPPFYVDGSRLALMYEDEAVAVLNEAVAVRGKRKAA